MQFLKSLALIVFLALALLIVGQAVATQTRIEAARAENTQLETRIEAMFQALETEPSGAGGETWVLLLLLVLTVLALLVGPGGLTTLVDRLTKWRRAGRRRTRTTRASRPAETPPYRLVETPANRPTPYRLGTTKVPSTEETTWV